MRTYCLRDGERYSIHGGGEKVIYFRPRRWRCSISESATRHGDILPSLDTKRHEAAMEGGNAKEISAPFHIALAAFNLNCLVIDVPRIVSDAHDSS